MQKGGEKTEQGHKLPYKVGANFTPARGLDPLLHVEQKAPLHQKIAWPRAPLVGNVSCNTSGLGGKIRKNMEKQKQHSVDPGRPAAQATMGYDASRLQSVTSG